MKKSSRTEQWILAVLIIGLAFAAMLAYAPQMNAAAEQDAREMDCLTVDYGTGNAECDAYWDSQP